MTPKTADVCDACAQAQACVLPFQGYGQVRAFAGRIRTLRLDGGILPLRELVHQDGDDQVLVIDAAALGARAVFGDVMAQLALRKRWAGVIVHGYIRDSVEIDAMAIGVKALGTLPQRAELAGGGALDVPLAFGGVRFAPGARVLADADGVVLLPGGLHERDIAVADTVAATAAYARGG